MRSIALDIRSASAMSAFLGLEDRVLRPALVSLVESGDVSLIASSSNADFTLTTKGHITCEKHLLSSTEERTFAIYCDALTKKITWFRNDELIEFKDLRSKGFREISQYPSVRPRTADLRLSEIDAVVKLLQHSPEVKRDLIAIRGIEACRKWFLPALALVYSSDEQADLQIGVVIDGKLSPAHEPAVWASHGFSEFVREALSSQSRAIAEVDNVRRSNSPQIQESMHLTSAITKAEGEKSQVVVILEKETVPVQQVALQAKVESLEGEIARLNSEARLLPVRYLYMQDHAPLLNDALTTARGRLLILSPWIRANVVDQSFLKNLELLLISGVTVHIGHGITPHMTRAKSKDSVAKAALDSLAQAYNNCHVVRLGNTHAKVLIKDSEYAAVTSFNWLSFGGDPALTYRDEQGVLIQRCE